MPDKSIAERLKALEEPLRESPSLGDTAMADLLASIRAEVEAVAREMRCTEREQWYGCTCGHMGKGKGGYLSKAADRLSGEK